MAESRTRILLIEDEEALRASMVEILESGGYEAMAARDGAEGLELAAVNPPDLVLTDLLTPRMHGYEVIRTLRSQNRTCRVPIVVVSGQAYANDQRKALELGANSFLAKPFRREDLLEAVRRAFDTLRVRFWGVRGSIAAPGPETVRYGGNTPCVTVEKGRDLLILDAGTGLRKLGLALQAEAGGRPLDLKMLITHTHWDHIQGFPFFVPAFVPGNRLRVFGPPSVEKPLEKVLRGQMDAAYFPVALGDMAAEIAVTEIRNPCFDIDAFQVDAMYINHPGITMAYRIRLGDKLVVYATDTEPYRTLLGLTEDTMKDRPSYGQQRDEELVEFARGADLYIADSQYTPEEYESKRGWGHTCYSDAVLVALRAQAKRLVLFSHDPMHDDDTIDRKLADCRRIAEQGGSTLEVHAAIEGSFIEIL